MAKHGKGKDQIVNLEEVRQLTGRAVDLSELQKLQSRTKHETHFRSCNITVIVVGDDSGKVQGYQMVIIDPQENHSYLFNMNQELKMEMIKFLNNMPDVGSDLPQEQMH